MNSNADDATQVMKLLLLSADEIPYDSLSTEMLAELAVQTSEPFVATSALGELTQRDPHEVKVVANRILEQDLWDPHLTAFALTVLYDRDAEAGFKRMASLAGGCDDARVLAAMMENVLSDAERFESGSWAPVAHMIARRVANADPAEFSDAEQRIEFLRRFGESGRG